MFISGTDTGVGKTVVTALLTRALRSLGVDCVAMKPLASGCEWKNGALESEDANFLRAVGGFDLPLDLVCPIRLELPLAPLVAAKESGVDTRGWSRLAFEAFQELRRQHEWVLVEGVGGWLVPLWRDDDGSVATCADLAASWQLPVLVVARCALGTINHTALTCRAIEQSAALKGVVFCEAKAVGNDDLAARTSPQIACEVGKTRTLGTIPHVEAWEQGVDAVMNCARTLLEEETAFLGRY